MVFQLDTSRLGITSTAIVPSDMEGTFRDLQLHLNQSGLGQDMEVHYVEMFLTLASESKE